MRETSATLVQVQHAGHLSNVERPAAFNTVMSEFLGSLLYN